MVQISHSEWYKSHNRKAKSGTILTTGVVQISHIIYQYYLTVYYLTVLSNREKFFIFLPFDSLIQVLKNFRITVIIFIDKLMESYTLALILK